MKKKYFEKIILFILSLPFFILVKLIKPIFLIRFREIPSERIGHFAIETELYLCEKNNKLRKNTKTHIDIFFVGKNISNKYLLKLYKKKIIILPRNLVLPINSLCNLFARFFKIENPHIVEANKAFNFDCNNLIDKSPVYLKFNENENENGKKIMEQMKIPLDKKIVALFLRDEAYLKKTFPGKDFSYHKFRNYKIEKFLPAIKALIDKDYYVIRMGKYVEEKFPLKNQNFLDYPFCRHKSDFMDLYLINRSSFCISTGTGLQEIAHLFRKHLVEFSSHFNRLPLFSKKILTLSKKMFWKKNKKMLTISEIISSGAINFNTIEEYKEKGIDIVDNNENEIKDVILEMTLKVNADNYYTNNDFELQNQFKKLYPSNLLYRGVKIHGELRSNYSIDFLRNNQSWIS